MPTPSDISACTGHIVKPLDIAGRDERVREAASQDGRSLPSFLLVPVFPVDAGATSLQNCSLTPPDMANVAVHTAPEETLTNA